VRESRTLGSVRGGAGRLWAPLHGHEAGNGGYAPSGRPTAATSSLLLGDRKDITVSGQVGRNSPATAIPPESSAQNGALKKFEDVRQVGATLLHRDGG